jgi:hypothetical protein
MVQSLEELGDERLYRLDACSAHDEDDDGDRQRRQVLPP